MKEEPGYIELDGLQLYYVRHVPEGKVRGRVLMAGPLGLERQNAYITIVRWARLLASSGFQTMRFDYRCTAESTGRFEDARMSDWMKDVGIFAEILSKDATGPLVLCGLRIGALVTAGAFARGTGDAMLLWDPPDGGRKALLEVLRRRLASDYAEGTGGPRKTREEYVADLESGATVTVEGYDWTPGFWEDAGRMELDLPEKDDARPWKALYLNRKPPKTMPAEHTALIKLARPPFWGNPPRAVPDTGDLFDVSLEFIRSLA
ncbi:MAG: hypothetical protein GXP54_08365 [Deltaproteobacteria bacterium]|nr:hypothetical protein [Deltaproteobacteria bacterium]